MSDFEPGDIVTIDDGPTEYTVRAVHSYGKDVLVSQDPDERGHTWVAIEQVALLRKAER